MVNYVDFGNKRVTGIELNASVFPGENRCVSHVWGAMMKLLIDNNVVNVEINNNDSLLKINDEKDKNSE